MQTALLIILYSFPRLLTGHCGSIVALMVFGNSLVITFVNITSSQELEKEFFRFIVNHGIPVK
jgi:hypothetical protein